MPGKTNPVTVEAAMLVSAQVMGLDRANQVAGMLGRVRAQHGRAARRIQRSHADRAPLPRRLGKLSSVVVDHIVPNAKRSRAYAESSPALITAISPQIGYDKAAKVGKEVARGLSIREGLKQLGYTDREVDKILGPPEPRRPTNRKVKSVSKI